VAGYAGLNALALSSYQALAGVTGGIEDATVVAAFDGADVICTATRSQAPLFEVGDLAPQAHINAIGAYTADMCEIPADAFAKAAIVAIDQLEAVMAEAGDLIQAIDAGQLRRESLVEIGHLLASRDGPPAGLTIFKSVGIAAQDWALGELVVSRARERGAIASDAGADILPA
jgi:ornithine cyclodeaminase